MEPVDTVGDRRAARARLLGARREHEVVDEQLRAPVEELGQRPAPTGRVERVVLLDADPGQLLAGAGELVAPARVLLLALEQLDPLGTPLVSGRGAMHLVLQLLSKSVSSLSKTLLQPVLTDGLSKFGGACSMRSCTSTTSVAPPGASRKLTVKSVPSVRL